MEEQKQGRFEYVIGDFDQLESVLEKGATKGTPICDMRATLYAPDTDPKEWTGFRTVVNICISVMPPVFANCDGLTDYVNEPIHTMIKTACFAGKKQIVFKQDQDCATANIVYFANWYGTDSFSTMKKLARTFWAIQDACRQAERVHLMLGGIVDGELDFDKHMVRKLEDHRPLMMSNDSGIHQASILHLFCEMTPGFDPRKLVTRFWQSEVPRRAVPSIPPDKVLELDLAEAKRAMFDYGKCEFFYEFNHFLEHVEYKFPELRKIGKGNGIDVPPFYKAFGEAMIQLVSCKEWSALHRMVHMARHCTKDIQLEVLRDLQGIKHHPSFDMIKKRGKRPKENEQKDTCLDMLD